jgi:SAM-dependent methyltransferase
MKNLNHDAVRTCKACGFVVLSPTSVPVHSFVPSLQGGFFTCTKCGTECVDGHVDYDFLYTSRDSTNYPTANFILVSLKKLVLHRTAARILEGYDRTARILDYGCGGGELANAIDDIGFSSVFAADLQAERPPTLDVSVTYLGVQELAANAPFDVVILRHVIEHFERPAEVLASIVKHLSPDGVIIAEFPSAASFWKRLMGPRWTGYFFPYHTMVLSEAGARHIFTRAGLVVRAVRNVEPPIFGVYLMSLGVPRSVARVCSGLLFPLQVLGSKLAGRSEAQLFELSLIIPSK